MSSALAAALLVLLVTVGAVVADSSKEESDVIARTDSSYNSDIRKKVILTDQAPSPLGPYSQGIKVSGGSTLYVAGQIGLIPGTTNFASDEITGQTDQTLRNIGNILKAAGANFSNVVKCTIFLADMNDFAAMNAVYATYFNVPKPAARAAFAAASLPKNARVEIDCIAVV